MEEKHLKVAWTHIYVSVFYGIVALALLCYTLKGSKIIWNLEEIGTTAAFTLFLCIPAIFHLLLARGAAAQSETARKTSRVVGYIMLVGFPIGTFVGMHLLAHTESWQEKPLDFDEIHSLDGPPDWPQSSLLSTPASSADDPSTPDVPKAEKKARHHYVFAHNALRDLAFAEPVKILPMLASDNSTHLFDVLLQDIDRHLAEAEPETFIPRTFTSADIHVFPYMIGDRPCAIIQMPPPTHPAEAYFAAIVSKISIAQIQKQEADTDDALIEYYTLERPTRITPDQPSVFCAWAGSGAHLNFGAGPPPVLDEFLPFLSAFVQAEETAETEARLASDVEQGPASEEQGPDEYVHFVWHLFVSYTQQCYEDLQKVLDAHAVPHGSSTILEIACLNLFFLQEEMQHLDDPQYAAIMSALVPWMMEPFLSKEGSQTREDFVDGRLSAYREMAAKEEVSAEDWRTGRHRWGDMLMSVWIDAFYAHILAHRNQPDALELTLPEEEKELVLEAVYERLAVKSQMLECLLRSTVFLVMTVQEMLLAQDLPALTPPELQRIWDTANDNTWQMLMTQSQSSSDDDTE